MYSKLTGYFRPSRSLQRQLSMNNNGYLTSEDSDYFSSAGDQNDAMLRFIVIRHGERVDSTYGPGWTRNSFNYAGEYYPFDANMPPTLPARVNWLDYEIDTPLTLRGLQQSWNVGNALAQQSMPITACYSSPAIRSIQTADQILAGMVYTPIRVELGLFECSSWYARVPVNFMSYQELINSGFNVDTQYHSAIKNLRSSEDEYQYYERSKDTMKKIFKLHRKTGGTILFVAHAPSLEVLTRHLMNEPPRPEQLIDIASRVDYCSMTIIDRDPLTKSWQFRYSLDNRANWQQPHLNQALSRSATISYVPNNVVANYII